MYEPMVRQAERVSGMSILSHNGLELFHEAPAFVDRLVGDIDAAASHVHLLYFIFVDEQTSPLTDYYRADGRLTVVPAGGTVEEVAAALAAVVRDAR